jgi:glycosyltransferase involved in cell wall biosynthesis
MAETLKVFHLINSLSSGGAELHLLSLCQHLRRLGVNSVVAYLKEHVRGSRSLRYDFETEGFRVINLQADMRYDWRLLGRFAAALGEESPRLVHTHLPRADFAGGLRHLVLRRTPWVCSIHDIYSESWSGHWALPLFGRLWRRTDGLIAISQAVKDWLVAEWHIPPAQIAVIHYGIEASRFRSPHADPDIAADTRGPGIIGSIGRLEPRKGHETLIRAMPEILQRLPEASLQIAGHDPWDYGQVLQAVINDLGLERQVQLLGFRDDVPAFLHGLDVFALASHSEGFGQVIIEAMAAGKPVVASRIAPFTEIVLEGETGLLVESKNPKAFADAICWLLTHPRQAQQMGKCGQEQIRGHFSAERMAEQTFSLYHELLSRRR